MLKIENLNLSLNHTPILKGIDLEIKGGEFHIVLGINGSGKTTLAYTIMGLSGYSPSSGRIIFKGRDITSFSITERAKLGITLAWQHPASFEGITIGDYLGLSSKGNRHIDEALSLVGLEPEIFRDRLLDSTLSGGERKRIELASVVLMKPKLAILDEPDSGIDVLSVKGIVDILKLLNKKGITIFLITHREEITLMADRASLLCGGVILKSGRPKEVVEFYAQHCKRCDHINEPDINIYG